MEKCILCYPRVETGQAPACFHSCPGRIRYMGPLLYDMDKVAEMAARPEDELVEAQRELILDPNDPEGDRSLQGAGHQRRLARRLPSLAGLQDGDRLEHRAAAAPRVPHDAVAVLRAAGEPDDHDARRARRLELDGRLAAGARRLPRAAQVPGVDVRRRQRRGRQGRATTPARSAPVQALRAGRRRREPEGARRGRPEQEGSRPHVPAAFAGLPQGALRDLRPPSAKTPTPTRSSSVVSWASTTWRPTRR